jgi:flagellar motor switch/type III secretory pathway protein FliN
MVIAKTTGQQNAVNTIPIKFSIEVGRVRLSIITAINPISNNAISP